MWSSWQGHLDPPNASSGGGRFLRRQHTLVRDVSPIGVGTLPNLPSSIPACLDLGRQLSLPSSPGNPLRYGAGVLAAGDPTAGVAAKEIPGGSTWMRMASNVPRAGGANGLPSGSTMSSVNVPT